MHRFTHSTQGGFHLSKRRKQLMATDTRHGGGALALTEEIYRRKNGDTIPFLSLRWVERGLKLSGGLSLQSRLDVRTEECFLSTELEKAIDAFLVRKHSSVKRTVSGLGKPRAELLEDLS